MDYLKILSKWECPTCGHSLVDRVDHCGEDGSHLSRKTQKNAEELLRILYKIPSDKSTKEGLIAAGAIKGRGGKREGAGGKPLEPIEGPRVLINARIRARNRAKIEKIHQVTGERIGNILDRAIEALP